LRAISAWLQKDYKQAAAFAREGLKIAPYKNTLHEALAIAYLHDRRHAESLKAADAGIEACPDHLPLRLLRVRALHALGRSDAALQSLAETEAKIPTAAEQVAKLRGTIQKR